MDDSRFFLAALREFDENHMNEAAWAKAITLENGDADQAKYQYIRIRVEQMSAAETDENDAEQTETVPGNDLPVKTLVESEQAAKDPPAGYARVSEWVTRKGGNSDTERSIVEGIRNGELCGRIQDGVWFIYDSSAREEVVQAEREYESAESFGQRRSMPTQEVIEFIRDGTFRGRIKHGQWYVEISAANVDNSTGRTTPAFSNDASGSRYLGGIVVQRGIGWVLLFLSALGMAMCTSAGPEAREFVMSPAGGWLWLVWVALLIGGVTLTNRGKP